MGVKGLTTYLKENRHKLAYTVELNGTVSAGDDPANAGETRDIRVVVDGWSLLYTLYNISGEPWVYGGEYAALAQHAAAIVTAWRQVGIQPTFVFDGPTPPLKYPTSIARIQDNRVRQANLFFRTSAAARSTPRSLAETRIAPPLGYVAVVSTLLSMGDDVKVEFAEGEADSYSVALAGRLGAYVTGNDSDFIILNCEGYKGYIPLDEMVWCASVNDTGVRSSESSSLADDSDSEFQIVTRKKRKGKAKMKASRMELGTGPLPPSSPVQTDVALLLTVYEPATFAKHLSLPPSLLPLLGALIGNDYGSFDFFRSSESPVDRVQRVADTLSSVLKEAQSGNAKKIRKIDRGGQGSVMDVIGTTVERLLLWRDPRYPPSSGQIDKITETVVQSTLEYAMDDPTLLFPDKEENGNRNQDSQSQSSDDPREQVRNLYLNAYHRGVLHPRLLETFARGSCFPTIFLEDPDRECCARSIGRPIREVIWKIFVASGGIPDKSEPTTDVGEQINDDMWEDEDEDEDELVDVVEEASDDDETSPEDDDDPLAALRGRLQRLSFSEIGPETSDAVDLSRPDTEPHTPTSYVEIPKRSHRPKIVTEYMRRGTRIVAEDCEVAVLGNNPWDDAEDSRPVQLRPVEDRLRIFLKVLGSDTPGIRAVAAEDRECKPCGKLLLVVALRWVLQTLHVRTEELEDSSRKRERDREKWTRSEAQAFLVCLSEERDELDIPPIEDRAIQLSAQMLSALEAVGWLAQTLLLVDPPDSHKDVGRSNRLPVVLGQAEKIFSGRKFHTALARPKQSLDELSRQLWDATSEGLEDVFGEERGKRGKKERKEKRKAAKFTDNREEKAPGAGMFGILAGLEVQ